uniref:uncharacterized protein LOC120327087 n=1 Tax=Styela clava TaxID=7725 RepID=UPI001939503F|nr:uncharacterized protein LOC120327087 [Styela clava]
MNRVRSFFLFILGLILLAMLSLMRVGYRVFENTPLHVTDHYNIKVMQAAQDGNFTFSKTQIYPLPNCQNLLINMTSGHWVKKTNLEEYADKRVQIIEEEKEIWYHLNEFWNKRGVTTSFWRSDGKCGYKVNQKRPPNSTWPATGSWCDKYSSRPCCSDVNSGICMAPSEENCNCNGCYDTRNIAHAELSKWITTDARCTWHYYSTEQACDIIESSKYSNIIFAGDSLNRNMFSALMSLLTGDIVSGSLPKGRLSGSWRKICTGPERYYWKQCRESPMYLGWGLEKYNEGVIKTCIQNINTVFKAKRAWIGNLGIFKKEVETVLGQKGSLFVFGYALHIDCQPEKFVQNYLTPILDMIDQYYRTKTNDRNEEKWPKLIVTSAPNSGLMKPQMVQVSQGPNTCSNFNRVVRDTCNRLKIPFLDFFPFTTGVFSFDGTHHAYDVNALKVQLFLNYIASEK